MVTRAAASCIVLLAVLGGASAAGAFRAAPPGSAPSLAPAHGAYSPSIDPPDFVATIDNPYLPFKPGTRFHYQGVKGFTPQTDDRVVLRRTVQILGVTCTVVRDTVSEHGRPVGRTFDWYAQDKYGNVWYFGEESHARKHGRFVTAIDSWQAGVNGGRPGIVMPGNPQPDDVYRQEFYPTGKALEEARVLPDKPSVTVPFGTLKHALLTRERSPLEPQTEMKFYVAGIGEVAEHTITGRHEMFLLVSVRAGGAGDMRHTAGAARDREFEVSAVRW